MNDNPMIEMYPVDYVNNPFVIGKNDKMVSINATIEVDLLGQCCSESLGHLQWSGTGGQADFVRGANVSRGREELHHDGVDGEARHDLVHRSDPHARGRR